MGVVALYRDPGWLAPGVKDAQSGGSDGNGMRTSRLFLLLPLPKRFPGLRGPSKTAPTPTLTVLSFSEVARLNEASSRTQVNGGASSLVQPTAKDAFGLTDEETRILNELAADYESKNRLLTDAVRRLTWEARIRAVGSENIPAGLAQQLKGLEDQRRQMALDHLQRLRTAFGDSRFQTLHAYVRSKEMAGRFFPPDPTGKPVLRKTAPLQE